MNTELINEKARDLYDHIIGLPLGWKLIMVVLIILLGFFAYPKIFSSQQTPKYAMTQVTKGTIISTISQSGNVTGNQTSVSSPTSGVIEELYVQNGQYVNAGDNLFKVKSTATPEEQASAYSTYQSALNSLASAKNNQQSLDAQMWSAQKSLQDAQSQVDYINDVNNTINPSTKQPYTDLEKQSINTALTQAQKNFSASEQKYKDSQLAITAAQAQVSSAWLAYQATKTAVVTAPITGTVGNLSVGIGSTVSSSGGNNSLSSSSSSSSSSVNSSPVLIIGNFADLQIKLQINEVDITKIKVGQIATITLDALPDKSFVGKVSSVDNVGTSNSGVVQFNVYVRFMTVPSDIKSGMSANVSIQTAKKDNVLIVPSTAVQNSNGESTVRVLQNGKLSIVSVDTGISSDSDTEIVSGLKEGDTIVTSIQTSNRTSSGQSSSPFSSFGNRGFGGGNFGGAVRVGGGR